MTDLLVIKRMILLVSCKEKSHTQIWCINREENNQTETITLSKHLEIDQQVSMPDDLVWTTDNLIFLKVANFAKYLTKMFC